MPLHLDTPLVEDRDSLKEIQKALKQGNTTGVLERFTDSTLIQLLRRLQRPSEIVSWISLALLGVVAIAFLGVFFHLWALPHTPILMVCLFFAFRMWRFFEIKPKTLEAIKPRLEQATIPTLLDAYALNITALEETLRQALSKRLAVATTEDLEALSLNQRKQLAHFTLTQVCGDMNHSPRRRIYSLPDDKAQAATVGFLALASLKQPGAEQITPETISENHVNLRRAIEEYHSAMKAH